MPEVLGLDVLGKLIHNDIFYKCLNRTLVMPEVVELDALGKLIYYYIFYKCSNKTQIISGDLVNLYMDGTQLD